jgi:uncharacterized membrane-anchored protein
LFGREITLTTEPVDPTDMFRGDYVQLEYSINNIDMGKMPKQVTEHSEEFYSKEMYAVLKKEGDIYTVDYVTLAKPLDKLFLKCNLKYVNDWEFNNETAYVDYHLDKFFVPENTGLQLEELARKGDLLAKVKVFNGYALLVDIAPR